MTHPVVAATHAPSTASDDIIDLRDPFASRPPKQLTVAVVGLGYVGLPTVLSLRQAGRRVIGLDVSTDRLNAIRQADVDLSPADLAQLQDELAAARADDAHPAALDLTADAHRLADADAIIICVPTPVSEELIPDLRALRAACHTVVEHVRAGQTIVLTSTSYVGCTRDLLHAPLTRRGLIPGQDVHVAFSPERIDPGVPDHRPLSTPRVLGGLTPDCARAARDALSGTSSDIHLVSSPEVAEFTKLLENTFRAVNIAFANEIADVAHELGLPADETIDAAATKPYGFMRFTPGPGVGGHCIPCDPHYLLWQLRGRRMSTPVIEAAMTGIAVRPRKVVARIREELAERGIPMHRSRIHLVGAAYKPGVADVRESPALEILAGCRAAGAHVSYTDTHIPQLTLGADTLHSIALDEVDADIVVIHTLHPGQDEAAHVTLERFPVVLDTTFRLGRSANRVLV